MSLLPTTSFKWLLLYGLIKEEVVGGAPGFIGPKNGPINSNGNVKGKELRCFD